MSLNNNIYIDFLNLFDCYKNLYNSDEDEIILDETLPIIYENELLIN